ncbi:UNVERIFIED_CONTAM: hypothetical protein GTU68_021984 [Idotea baltica]|nr:hypothetical protein [Idotea baltica]
MKLIVRHLHIT